MSRNPGAEAPANPSPHYGSCPHCNEVLHVSPGLTKREELAARFMCKLLEGIPAGAEIDAVSVAGDAVKLADSLLDLMTVV